MNKTLENNKLIAEFMGWKTHPKYGKDYVINKDKLRKVPYWSDISYESIRIDLAYNVSWDWLMPVVEKISKLDTLNKEKDFNRALDKVLCLPIDTKIDAVYSSVVKFVKWYNIK